jgi:hypothetical protein
MAVVKKGPMSAIVLDCKKAHQKATVHNANRKRQQPADLHCIPGSDPQSDETSDRDAKFEKTA